MSSTRIYAHVSLGIRLIVLICCIGSMLLIMTAPGVCFWRTINSTQQSREICPPSFFPMNIDRWGSALHFQMRGQNVWGQLVIIILSFIFALAPMIFTCIYLTSGRSLSFSQIIASGVGVIAFLIFGAFEVKDLVCNRIRSYADIHSTDWRRYIQWMRWYPGMRDWFPSKRMGCCCGFILLVRPVSNGGCYCCFSTSR